jgi:hypothetical protein
MTTDDQDREGMSDQVTYYAVVGPRRSVDDPSGLARRTVTTKGRLDESLRRDLTWTRSAEIYEWERGEEMGPELVEISGDEAERLIERFREKWGAGA